MATKNEAVRKVGRPAAVLQFPRGAFTVAELAALNPTVCTLTVRNHIKEGLEGKFLVRMDKAVMTGEAGRPAHRYIRKSVADAFKARKGKAKAPATVTVEVATVAPATAAVEAAPVAVETAPVAA
jgi:hypothetical protein